MAIGIDKESEVAADLQIGPTSLGMVRIYVATEGLELPLDFDPDEAEEIADEIRAAAVRARETAQGRSKRRSSGKLPKERERDGTRHEGVSRGGSKRRAGSGSPS